MTWASRFFRLSIIVEKQGKTMTGAQAGGESDSARRPYILAN